MVLILDPVCNSFKIWVQYHCKESTPNLRALKLGRQPLNSETVRFVRFPSIEYDLTLTPCLQLYHVELFTSLHEKKNRMINQKFYFKPKNYF